MREELKRKHAELRARMKKYDEALLKMINVRTRETIIKVIKDFLQQHES